MILELAAKLSRQLILLSTIGIGGVLVITMQREQLQVVQTSRKLPLIACNVFLVSIMAGFWHQMASIEALMAPNPKTALAGAGLEESALLQMVFFLVGATLLTWHVAAPLLMPLRRQETA